MGNHFKHPEALFRIEFGLIEKIATPSGAHCITCRFSKPPHNQFCQKYKHREDAPNMPNEGFVCDDYDN